MSEQSIVRQEQAQGLSLKDQVTYANTIARGQLVPVAYRNSPADVLIAIGLGQSMGLSPAESLYRINVIKGKPSASAELIAAQVRKAGHKLRITKDDEAQSVTATIVRHDDPDYPISETRDKAWAKQMGLLSQAQYVKQPMTMLTWRAITAVARVACPEALYGVAYTPDELSDFDAPSAPVDSLQVEAPQPEAVDLAPIRARFKAYTKAIGLSATGAMEALCKSVGSVDMQHMSAEDVAKAVKIMDDMLAMDAEYEAEQPEPEATEEQPAQPEQEELPDMYAEDVDF